MQLTPVPPLPDPAADMASQPQAITVVGAVLAGAGLLEPVREIAGRQNDGYMIRAIQAATGNAPPEKWCASFVAYVGRGILGARWPLPATASCDDLLEFARRHAWLVEASDGPERGDVFLQLRTAADAIHTGFVTGVDQARRFRTIEGNTNGGGSSDGDGVYRRTRGGAADRATYAFIRWTRGVK